MSNLAYGTFTITNLSTVTSVDVYYYNSTSSTSLSGGSWSTNAPTWTNGKYIWSKTVTTWEQGVTTESKPVCITGQKGSTGAAGQSVTKITQQYALGTNSTTAPTSGWSTAMPAFESGKFYWTRSEIVWTNPSSTTYTTAVLANGLTSANTNAETAKTDAASAVSTANTANQTANTANQTANTANQTAQNAVSIANGKNTIYYSSSKPTGGTYKAGDTWFNLTTDGYRLYEYDATAKDWVQKSMDGKSITAGTVTAAQIHAGAITTDKLATNAIKSVNYAAGIAPYSLTGTFLDLSNGNIFTPNFGVNNDSTDNIDNGAYIKGTIQAYDGKIGSDNNNYWYIGNYFDYNQGQSAMIRSHGTAAIQLGDSNTWRLSTNRIHTAWNDDSTSGEAFRLHYPTYSGKYWDSGLHVPASATDKLLYIRNAATTVSLENLQNDIDDNSGGNYWNYQFYLTNDGSLYAKNIYIMDDNGGTVQIGGTNGVYLLKSGGTISGNLEITGTLKMQGNFLNKSGSAITLQTNLASTSAATLTGNSTSPIKLGVTGTLPVANGGTGNTNYTSGGIVYVSNTNPKTLLSNAAGTSGQLLASGGSGVPTWVNASSLTVAAATKATQDGNGKVIATTYLPLTGGNVTGPVNFGDSVSIDDLTAGTLIVTGSSSFTNNAQFNTINGVTVGSNPKFTDTTYTFDGTYNASSNKAATVSTVTNAINALDVSAIAGATNKTLTSISETNGKISATYSNISITKSQVSDFPTSMPASDVSAWAKASTKPTYKQDEILPLQSKTFTNVIGTANSWAGATFFYGSIKPATWGEIWRIKYRIKVFVPGQPNYNQMADVMISGRAGDLRSYASFNTIGAYYVCYYHVLYRMKEAGFNNGYGHSLGVRFYSAYNPTDTNYKRTIDVEILETENCTFNFYDNCLLYADVPGTGSTNYNTYTEIDFVNNGLQETGDNNDVNYYNRTNYSSRTTSAALYRYQFCLTKSDGTLIPVNSVNNSVATNKTLTTDSFDPFGDIFFWNSTSTYAANANMGNSSLYRQYVADLRYSFNCGGYDTTPILTARAPLYLVATPQTDGTAKLYTQPLSMELPTSADGLIYIYLGRVYEDTKPYRVVLSPKHPVYEYRNGAVRTYTGLKSETAVSSGTDVSLVTTGQKYLWNSKTSNTGTVTSVAASGSGGITISGSPVTTSGTIAVGLNLSTAINGLGEGTSAAHRDDYIVAQYAGGGTITTSYHRRKLSNIFAALSADDIPNLAWSKITSGNDDLKAIEALTGTSGFLKKTAANTWTLDTNTYVTSSGVTSITLTQGTGISIGSSGTAITSTGTRTISLADNYGDTKNPYASKTARYVLAAPAAQAGAPTFRALTNADVGLSNVTNNKQVKGLSSGTTSGNLVTWGSDGYTVADSGIAKGSVATKITLSGTDYTVSSNIITITKANLQSAIQDTSLVLMTAAERSKLSSIKVSEGGTIDFSGVTASAPITATVNQTTKAVNITHNTSGVSAGTYRSVTVNTYGHVTAGTNPTTLSGYGITDAKIASGVITLGSNTITPLTASSTLDATKLSGTASISTTGNATTATKFSSNRSIALSGDTTGSASSNGESGWSITTKTSKMTTLADNRSVATTPNDYKNQIIFQGLKANSYINSPSNAVYSYLVGLRGWSDNSGGNAHELAFNDNGIFRRNGATDTWGSWYKLIDSGNYNSYSPTLTGTGASGTWDIDISGNAVTATSATSAASATKATKDGDGNTISSTYLKLSGGTVTGITQFNKTIRDANGQHYYGGAANRSQWYKITLAHNGVVPPTTDNQWYMCSMTIHMAGDYNICPRGTIELCYYIFWDKTKYNADKVYATGYGPNINKAKVYYNLTDPFVLYIDSSNPYTSIWVDYVSYRDSAQSHNSKETKVEITNAITIADYTVVPTTYLYTTNGNYFYTSTHLRPTSNNTLNLGDSSYKWANIYATTFNGALNGNATKATQDSDGNQINTTYLKLAGGTMTGVLNAKRNEYEDSYSGALNMNNSNIYGLNSIYTSDTSDSSAEGIHFYRDDTHVDSIHAKSGVLYFTPNRPLGEAGTSYSIYHTGITTFSGNATTATEFSSNATVTLTGDTTGTSAGSKKSWSITTTTKKLSQTTTTALSSFTDTTALIYTAAGGSNAITDKPTSVDAFGCLSFKTAEGWYGQLLMSSNVATGIYWRTATSLSGGWKKLLDSNNYTDYTVKKDGTGASGTWGISITGNATTANKITNIGSSDNASSTDTWRNVWISYNDNVTGRPAVTTALAFQTSTGTLKATTFSGNLSGNATTATSATKATQDGSGNIITNTYLKKTGDTMVGTLSWNSTSLPQFSGSPTYLVGIQGFANGGTMKWQQASSVTVGAATKATQDKNGNDITTKYVTIDTTQTITGRKTFSDLAAVTFKPSSGTDKCNINYDASLGALVFSF